jgi:hypothetical protein
LRARLAILIIGDFALSNLAHSLNIPLAKLVAKGASSMRARRSDFEGLPTQVNFVLKNRLTRNCDAF